MTSIQRDFLALNTKFILTSQPRDIKQQINNDFATFARRVRLQHHFSSSDNSSFLPKFYIPNANPWQPPPAPPSIETWLTQTNTLLNNILDGPLPRRSLNISPKQNEFLQQLRNNPSIVIKPADKNLGLTLLDRTTYDNEALRQLSDRATYELVAHIPLESIYNKITTIFNAPSIDPNIRKFIARKITPQTAKTPLFYHLPKVHKTILAGRPIVPSHSSITAPTSTWIDHVLQPYVKSIPTVAPDSTSVLNALEQTRIHHPQCTLITADVSSLYTNIPTHTGIAFTRKFLNDTVEDSLTKQEFINTVIQALTVVLTNNYFSFNDSLYLQKIGTAMGTPAAVVYANIFMYILEKQVLGQFSSSVLFYRRYLDDIFAILSDRPQQFIDALSRRHPSIKLETTMSSSSVNFLDLHIFKGPRFAQTGILDTSVHQKQLNSYLYLPYSSFHPPHSKGGLIVTELMRYVRNCSSFSDYIDIKHTFYFRLRARGYPINFLRFFFNKVRYADRARLLQPRKAPPPHDRNKIYFTTEYNSITSKLPLTRILRTYLKDPCIIPQIGFKRTRNLHNLLCSNTTPEVPPVPTEPTSGPNNPNNPEAHTL